MRKKPKKEREIKVHESKYKYKDLARQITVGEKGKYNKIKAIYQWMCDNIDYDTSYSTFSADECVQTKKGVCQSYCELLYQLAKAVGIKSEIIYGRTKNAKGEISAGAHTWILAYTSSKKGILLDPTWGAGSLRNNKFVRRKNCWVWFDVAPEWMLLTHFPDDKDYQFVSKKLSGKDFQAMSPVNDLWIDYGIDGMTLCQMVKNNVRLPRLYSGGEGIMEFIDFPQQRSLRIGEFYTFRIKMKETRALAIINNDIKCKTLEWKDEGNGIYSVNFMPRETGKVYLSLQNQTSNTWNHIIEYTIENPTQDDWNKVEPYYPLSLPEVKQVKNINGEQWSQVGIDRHQLLKFIREKQIIDLPDIYTDKGQKFKIVSVPMEKYLEADQAYSFRFYPQSGVRWALVNNDQWYEEFQVAPDGMYTMTINPTAGRLVLFVQFKEDGPYWTCLEYVVR